MMSAVECAVFSCVRSGHNFVPEIMENLHLFLDSDDVREPYDVEDTLRTLKQKGLIRWGRDGWRDK